MASSSISNLNKLSNDLLKITVRHRELCLLGLEFNLEKNFFYLILGCLEAEFLEWYRARMVIGKGGMGTRTTEAMQRLGAVYCAFTGGAGALAGQAIRSVKAVHWLDLGMPEALWTFDVADFGPLIVAIDTYGRNLHADVAKAVAAKRQQIYRRMGVDADTAGH